MTKEQLSDVTSLRLASSTAVELDAYLGLNQPPVCNTGEISARRHDVAAICDHWAGTFESKSLEALLEAFFGDERPEVKHGHHGYQKRWTNGLVVVYGDGVHANMGVHVQIHGQGWAQYRDRQSGSPAEILRILTREFAYRHTTRIDLAFDDYEGLLRMRQIAAAVEHGAWAGAAHKHQIISGSDGMTVYLGRRPGNQVRFYDKLAEQIGKGGHEVAMVLKAAGVSHWIRCELELREQRAEAMVQALIEGEDMRGLTIGEIRRVVDFRFPEGSTKKRWDVLDWWERFAGRVVSAVLDLPPKIKAMKSSLVWIDRQVMPTLRKLLDAKQGDTTWLLDWLGRGRRLPSVAAT